MRSRNMFWTFLLLYIFLMMEIKSCAYVHTLLHYSKWSIKLVHFCLMLFADIMVLITLMLGGLRRVFLHLRPVASPIW